MRNVVSKASIGLCVFGVLGNGCGGDKRECGPGTVLSGSQCIVAPGQVTPMPTSDGGDASMGVPSVPDASVDASVMPTPMPDATVVFRPTFGGVNSVAPASDSSLVVTWRPAKDAQTPREQLVYRVYVATAAGKQDFKKPTATSQPGSTSILLAGLTNNMPYYVVVRAVNQDGTEDTNTVEKDNRPRADSVAPTFGGVKSAKAVGAGSVELTWDAAKDDASPSEGITYTAFWSDKPGDAANGTFGGVSEPGAASMVVSGLPHSVTAYYFVVRAVDAAGNTDENVRSESATTTVDITPPQFAGCQSVIDTSAGAATLTWLPAKDDSTDPGSIVYTVFASTIPIQADGGGFDFAHRAEFKGGVTGRIGGLTQNTQWYFICQATDESGNQEHNLAQRRVKTQVDNVPPHFNGVTSASLEGFDKAKLTWEPASDDQTPAESIRYVVYQGEAAGAINFATPVATTAAAAKTFTVGSLKPGKSYFFTVRALDEGANQDTNIVERGLSTPSKVSFISVQAILTQRCANACHNSAAPPMGLIMQVGFAYQNLVNKPAVEDQPSSPDAGPLNVDDSGVFDAAGYVYQYRKRILPGDPENSYLFLKITGRPPVGNPMPPPSTGVTLTADEVSTIKNWILQGALSD